LEGPNSDVPLEDFTQSYERAFTQVEPSSLRGRNILCRQLWIAAENFVLRRIAPSQRCLAQLLDSNVILTKVLEFLDVRK